MMDSNGEEQLKHSVLCAKNCGFFGNPATHNMCSICYRDYLKEKMAAAAAEADESAASPELSGVEKPSSVSSPNPLPCSNGGLNASSTAEEVMPPTKRNRCHCCQKRTGLTGFSCRCGGLFCGLHRYPEEHNCKFDFRNQGCSLLAEQNPLCKGDKLDYRL